MLPTFPLHAGAQLVDSSKPAFRVVEVVVGRVLGLSVRVGLSPAPLVLLVDVVLGIVRPLGVVVPLVGTVARPVAVVEVVVVVVCVVVNLPVVVTSGRPVPVVVASGRPDPVVVDKRTAPLFGSSQHTASEPPHESY